jgi:trypsin
MSIIRRCLVRFAGCAASALVVTTLSMVSPAIADADPRIVGGARASIGQHLWTVFLATESQFQFCGGTLVARNKVVTAAHCVHHRTPAGTKVVWGREDKQSSSGVTVGVARIWVHPSYVTPTSGFDVAVLTLAQPLPATILPLASPADAALYRLGTNTLILGWGNTSWTGGASRYLLKAVVPLTSDVTCARAYDDYLAADMVCAGYPQGGVDTCQGDSGGPMTAGGKLIGITSWGQGCALPGYPGVYARVATHYPALLQQIRS